MTAMTTDQEAIPGLVLPAIPPGQDGPMARAAHATLTALAATGQLEVRHTVLVQLVQSLAGAIDRGVASGRASAVAMAAKQLLETMLVLDPPPEGPKLGDAAKRMDAFFQRIEDHANGGVA
jgi:hypothetical protein